MNPNKQETDNAENGGIGRPISIMSVANFLEGVNDLAIRNNPWIRLDTSPSYESCDDPLAPSIVIEENPWQLVISRPGRAATRGSQWRGLKEKTEVIGCQIKKKKTTNHACTTIASDIISFTNGFILVDIATGGRDVSVVAANRHIVG